MMVLAQEQKVGWVPLFVTPILSLLDAITKLAFVISTLLLIGMTSIYCFEIVQRYFFNSPSVWAQDTITYFLAAMIALAIPEVGRTRSHIAITVVVDALSSSKKAVALRVLGLLSFLISAAVFYITAEETYKLYTAGIMTLGTVAVPKWWIAVFIPIGFGLLALQCLRQALQAQALEPQSNTQ